MESIIIPYLYVNLAAIVILMIAGWIVRVIKKGCYSCGIFQHEDDSLKTAQQNKLTRKADIRKKNQILEIGRGWGSFALEATRQTGYSATKITISKAQYEMALQRV